VVLALTLGALVALPGCGGGGSKGKPIPRLQADQMIHLLQQADQQSQDGRHCGGADAKVREAQGVLDGVPGSVDKDVRQGIADGMDRLRSLIASQCQKPTQTDTTTSQPETTQSQTTPSLTEPTPSVTQTGPTDTNTTPVPTPTTPVPTSTGNGGVPTGTGAQGVGE